MKKTKMIVALLLAAVMVFSVVALVACNGDDDKPIELIMWAPSGAQTFYTEWANKWAENYTDSQGRTYSVHLGIQGEDGAADAILNSPEDGADVFCFVDDQVAKLASAGVLASLGTGTLAQEIKARNSEASITAASYNNELLAFPMQADNAYFLYYNSDVLSEDDIKDWSSLWAAVERRNEGKTGAERVKVAFDFGNAWYQASWFFSFGGTVSETDTNFDDPSVGYKALQAAYEFSDHQDLLAMSMDEVADGMREGSTVACVAGTWIYSDVTTNTDANIKLAVLPNIVLGEESVPMVSFFSCKLMGVNALGPNVAAARSLADYLTSEEVQIAKAHALAAGPSNINAAADPQIAVMPTVQVVSAQAQHSYPQINLPGGFWDALPTCVNPVQKGAAGVNDRFVNGKAVTAELDKLLALIRTGFFPVLD